MRLTKEGIAVVEGDMLLSKQVEVEGRLDVHEAHRLVDLMEQYIHKDGVVVDVGACIGDHTIIYSDMVGKDGLVYAFEPNPLAFECLKWNTQSRDNILAYNFGLGATETLASVIPDTYNIGASRLTNDNHGDIKIVPLDDIASDVNFHWNRLDFMKIDAEGYEPLILAGAKKTLSRLRPVLLIEVSLEQLGQLGFTPEDVYNPLEELGYRFHRMDTVRHQFDLLCI